VGRFDSFAQGHLNGGSRRNLLLRERFVEDERPSQTTVICGRC
jgi:hypothetical protein